MKQKKYITNEEFKSLLKSGGSKIKTEYELKQKKYRHIRTGKLFNPKINPIIDKNYWIEVL